MTSRIFILATLLVFISTSSHAKRLNGFELDNALIPVEEILPGGPVKDGIPALNHPKFVNAAESNSLKSDDIVMGLMIDKIARAYPIRIMNWHEIVNDTISGHNIVITYCPLCGSGMVFNANINGKDLVFGVSGLLYNSDVLLYDKATESLWSQLEEKAVTGAMKGKILTSIPVQQTTWSHWKKQYPKTQVLSFDTGFSRNYSRNPYAGYGKNTQLYFPLKFRSLGLHPKEKVIAIEINGKAKAWPLVELNKGNKLLEDQVGGQMVFIKYNAMSNSAKILDENKQLLSATTLFWFAWSAFHPSTALYQYKKDF